MKIPLVDGKYRLAAPDPVVEAMMDRSHERVGPLEWAPRKLPSELQAAMDRVNAIAEQPPRVEVDEATGVMWLNRPWPALEAQLDAEHERVSGELKWRPRPKPGLRGLGDAIKWLTDKAGIPQCGGCQGRQETLNRWFPFGSAGSK